MYALEMKNITKKFLAVTALDDVSIALKEGEILAICGENGAGKSTLMKVLSGSYPYGTYEGEIHMGGKRVRFAHTWDAEKCGIEMIYQEISLHLDLSVAENIFLGRLEKNKFGIIDWKKIYEKAKGPLETVGLKVDPKQKVRSLNTSQQQLLAIARALCRNPKVLVLDEPTSALTEAEAVNLMEILRKLRENGVSCLYISHKLNEVFEIADRITVIRDGKYVSTYDVEETNSERLIEDMVGRKIEALYPKVVSVIDEELMRVEGISSPHPFMIGRNIVDDVSFVLKKGEVLGIAGLVGAGRSELLNAIFKAETEGVTGKVFLNNKQLKSNTPRDMRDAGIGYVTEDRKKTGFVGALNIMQNITLASLAEVADGFLIRKGKETRTAQEYFEKLNIKAPSIMTNVMNLSGGNQQKVVLAKWMMTKMKVLLLDEPTRGIDVGAKAEIYKLINDMAAHGIGIIMVSSEMPELIAMCDRILVLGAGKICGEFSRQEVTQEKIMKAATMPEN